MEPIAITGIGCRFPHNVDSPQRFWQLICNGIDAITDLPRDRFDVDALYDPQLSTPGKIITQQGGFLENVDLFDPYFFGISPREAVYIDPQQRLLLEITWEALEDAGIVVDKLAGSQTGVFIGAWTSDYEDYMYSVTPDIDLYVTTGGGRYSTSGRLSYTFDLRGPSMTIDTACSSSLVAVHLACQSLWNGECTLALAGGVNLILLPQITIGYSRSKLLSADGRCKFGDARADGYVRSEGAGVVVLKPLASALADQDPIYAVIRGSAVSNDGRSSGLLVAPGIQGQVQTLQEAYRRAEVLPRQVQYIEAHGTGTSTGDLVEIKALGEVLGEERAQDHPCVIGSVKTNIGHTEAASGVAGLIKAALCLKHRTIPPSIHLRHPNPNIPWQELPLVVQQELGSWPVASGPALAGVNSFGVTGTNAHVVLEEAPQTVASITGAAGGRSVYVLPISAKSPQALKQLARSYEQWLSESEEALQDICYTASVRRSHHEQRVAVVGRSRDELAAALAASVQEEPHAQVRWGQVPSGPPPRLIFVFPGQGSQWEGMGRTLLEQEEVFRSQMQRCEQALSRFVDWSLLAVLTRPEQAARLEEIDVLQPVLFALQVSLAALLTSWGIEPDGVVGHSMGEVAAAHVAGMLSLEDAACIISRRSRLLRRLRGKGAMLLVELSEEEAQREVEQEAGAVSVAVSNSARSTVLSGEVEALERIEERMQQRGVFARRVKVDVASHSAQVEQIAEELMEQLGEVRPQRGSVPLYSTVSGQRCEGQELEAGYWMRNLREPVRFGQVVRRLLGEGAVTFVEISAHPILLPAIEQGVRESGGEGSALGMLRREEEEGLRLRETLAELYCQGYAVKWEQVNGQGSVVRLPSYAWQRERFWLEAETGGKEWKPPRRAAQGHPLRGTYTYTPLQGGMHIWELELGPQSFPFLGDHCVAGLPVLPAAVVVEIALAAIVSQPASRMPILEAVNFQRALTFTDGLDRALQLVSTNVSSTIVKWQLFSRPLGENRQDSWELHVTGTINYSLTAEDAPLFFPSHQDILGQRWKQMDQHEFYQKLAAVDLLYGESFQAVKEAWYGEKEALGRLRLPEAIQHDMSTYQVQPVLFDACLQLLVTTLCKDAVDGISYIPVQLGYIRIYEQPVANADLWGYAHVEQSIIESEQVRGEVRLQDAQGRPYLVAKGVCLQRLERRTSTTSLLDKLFYDLHWQSVDLSLRHESAQKVSTHESWLVFAGKDDVGQGLKKHLNLLGVRCVLVFAGDTYMSIAPDCWQVNVERPEDLKCLLHDAFSPQDSPCLKIVHTWSLMLTSPEVSAPERVNRAQEQICRSIHHLVQALAQAGWRDAPRLWLVTAGSHIVDGETSTVTSPGQALLWGLGRTLALEHPEWSCSCLDLSATPSTDEIAALLQEVFANTQEEQIVLRGQKRYVARLVPAPQQEETQPTTIKQVYAEEQPYYLKIKTPGILDTLYLSSTAYKTPAQGEVAIAVRAAGLNFLDVLTAMGTSYPGHPNVSDWLGLECAGVVVAVGPDVESVVVGDEVMAVTQGTFASFVIARANLVVHKPTALSFTEAATLPVAFMTVLYALEELGHLKKGERVLIHSAAGGVGLAAIQVAQQLGAEIFATAGSESKRAYLRNLGINHVFDSRSLSFGEQILQETGGRGVDVVLNSLTGEAITTSLSILAPYGRFLEIGKKDIYQDMHIGLFPFRKNLSYAAIDLARMLVEQEELCGELLKTIVERVEAGTLHPLSHQEFALSQSADAFRYMAQAQHIGKIVLEVETGLTEITVTETRPPIRKDATYLLSGGLGGIGLQVASWLVKQGARHLILLGRHLPTEQQRLVLTELERAGAHVIVRQADVAQEEQVARIFDENQRRWPPLQGIFHLAGVLDDGLLVRQEWQRFSHVLAPKVKGAWNLHQLSQPYQLDYFVLFSSATALLGSPGQSNYTAANAFLDELARYRRSLGLPALSINWGPWAQVGLAAAQSNRGDRLAFRGLESLQPQEAIIALEKALLRNKEQIAIMAFNLRQWAQFYPKAAQSPLLSEVAQKSEKSENHSGHILRDELSMLPMSQRRTALEDYLRSQISQVLHISSKRIDRHISLGSLGFDSLMALELRNRLESNTGLTLSSTLIWAYPTLALLTTYLAEQMSIPFEATSSQSNDELSQNGEDTSLNAELEQLSEAQLAALLNETLKSMDE